MFGKYYIECVYTFMLDCVLPNNNLLVFPILTNLVTNCCLLNIHTTSSRILPTAISASKPRDRHAPGNVTARAGARELCSVKIGIGTGRSQTEHWTVPP
jgi:hypothetical protein